MHAKAIPLRTHVDARENEIELNEITLFNKKNEKSKEGKVYHRKEGLIRLIKRNNSLKEETGLFARGLGRIIKAICSCLSQHSN